MGVKDCMCVCVCACTERERERERERESKTKEHQDSFNLTFHNDLKKEATVDGLVKDSSSVMCIVLVRAVYN